MVPKVSAITAIAAKLISPSANRLAHGWCKPAGAIFQRKSAECDTASNTVSFGPTAPGYLVGDDWGVGFTAGVLIEPTESTTIGVGYRSRSKHEVKGRAGAQFPGVPVESSKFDFTSPDVLTASVSHKLNDYIALHGTFE